MGEFADLSVTGGEDVGDVSVGAVPALEQNGAGPPIEQATGLVAHLLGRLCFRLVVTEQQGRLGQVRGDEVGDRQQVGAHSLDGIGFEEAVAGGRDHHRVDGEEAEPAGRGTGGDDFDEPARAEHPGFRGVDGHVIEHGVELVGHEIVVDRIDPGHTVRVLRDEGGDDGRAERSSGGEGLEVGVDSGSAAGVGAGDGQGDGRARAHS